MPLPNGTESHEGTELNPQKDTNQSDGHVPCPQHFGTDTYPRQHHDVPLSQMGAAQPTDIFIPTLITTAISTIVGVIAVSIAQRINLLNKPILILIGCISLFFAALIYLFTQISRDEMGVYSTLIANILLFSIILLFILWGLWKKINVYDAFIRRAKEGFTTAIRIIPYLVAFPRWNRRFPYFRRHGYTGERYRLCSRTIRCRYQLCRCPAHCPDESH